MLPSTQLGIDVSEFVHGFEIVDGRTWEHEELMNEDGFEVSRSQSLSFEDKYNLAIKDVISKLDETNFVTINEEQVPAGLYLTALIDNIIARPKIAWYSQNDNSDYAQDANQEIIDDLKDETFKEFMSQLQISWKLAHNREALYEFWGEKTHERFQYILNNYAPQLARASRDTSKTLTKEFIAKLNKKFNRKSVTGLENSLIWSTFGLLQLGILKDFPIVLGTHDRDDNSAYKTICSAVGQYIFWSIIDRVKRDTAVDSEEPSPENRAKDVSVTQERDFSDWEKLARDGNAEIWFNMCYSNYTYTDNDRNTKQAIFRKATNSFETNRSIEIGTTVLKWIVDLANRRINLKSYRINKPALYKTDRNGQKVLVKEAHLTHGLTLPNYIKYLAGKQILEDKKVKCGDEIISCKKYSDQLLLDFQYKQLWKAYWSLYQVQESNTLK